MELAYHEHLVPNIFLFVDRKCYPDWAIGEAEINFHDLTFVTSGKACYSVNGVEHLVEEGDLVYIAGGSTRKAFTFKDKPMHCYPFNFFWAGPNNEVELPFQTVTKNLISKEILDYIQEFKHIWMNKQPFYAIKARALFELILHRLLSSYYHSSTIVIDPRVKKITTFIEQHYADNLSLSEMAEIVNLHPVYMGKLFKEHMGISCKDYLNRIRLNNAEMMLSAGEFNVSETALRCGFQDISYFSNSFKRMKGYPPSAVMNKTERLS